MCFLGATSFAALSPVPALFGDRPCRKCRKLKRQTLTDNDERGWGGGAMGNETFYWDGLKQFKY